MVKLASDPRCVRWHVIWKGAGYKKKNPTHTLRRRIVWRELLCVKTRAAAGMPACECRSCNCSYSSSMQGDGEQDRCFICRCFFFFLFLYNYCTARNIHQKETFNDLYHRFFCDAQKTPRWIIILPNQLVSDQISHIFGSLRIIISVLLQHPVINLIINFFFFKNPAGSSYGRIYSLHLTVIRF